MLYYSYSKGKGKKKMVCVPCFRGGVGRDTFNLKGERNIRNTDKHEYNCGGYALGTFSWYEPFKRGECFNLDFDSWYQACENTERCVAVMLEEFKKLRRIESLEEVSSTETAIAFRISWDGDFHFVRRAKNHCWYHKRGNTPQILTMRTETVLSSVWCGRYDGPLVLFALGE